MISDRVGIFLIVRHRGISEVDEIDFAFNWRGKSRQKEAFSCRGHLDSSMAGQRMGVPMGNETNVAEKWDECWGQSSSKEFEVDSFSK